MNLIDKILPIELSSVQEKHSVKLYYRVFYILPMLILLPALFINLDLMPALGDEAIRALVALEFIYKNDYITPTLNGEMYYKKPPLFNWILLLIFNYAGRATEFFIRLPAVISLLIYSLVIYLTTRKFLGVKSAFINAFAFVTCGRMLFYDSMLGHIDILFSILIYLALFAIWYYHQNNKNYHFFVISYFLVGLAFLMKGFPSIVFLGLTFIGIIIADKSIKRFFSVAHVLGVLAFLLVVGTYFYLYSLKNNPLSFFETLWSESTKRTAFENNWLISLSYLFTFPFEYLFHLFPWTVLVICCFNKNIKSLIKENPFIRFCIWVVGINIIVYWLSPETRPRYLFPLIPYIFTAFIFLYDSSKESLRRITDIVLGVVFIIFALASIIPFFYKMPIDIPYLYPKTIFFFIALSGIAYLSFKFKSYKLVLLVITLLVARLEFDLFVLPVRAVESPEVLDKNSIIQASTKLDKNLPIFLESNVFLKYFGSYYLTRENNKLIRVNHYESKHIKNAYYVIEKYRFDVNQQIIQAQFRIENSEFLIVKFLRDE